MLHRVVQQLGHGHGQGGGEVRGQRSPAALAHQAGHLPADGVGRGEVADEAEDPVGHLVEVDVLPRLQRQGLVDDGDRGHPQLGLGERRARLLAAGPTPLQPQHRRDRLQVVLDPMVDLADRRVLADQRPLATPQVGDVLAEHQGPDPLALPLQRDATQQHGGGRVLDVGPAGDASGGDGGQRLVHGSGAVREADGQLGQRGADDVGGQAEPAEGADGVGAGVGHHARGVQAQDAVAHPRCGAGVVAGLGHGEASLDQHGEQRIGGGQVDLLELAGHPRRRRDVPRQDADDLPLAADRIGLHAAGHPRPLDVAQRDGPAVGDGLIQVRQPAARGEAADDVLGDDGGCRGRPQLGDGDQAPVVPRGHPQHEVAQAEVGDERPFAHDADEQVDVGGAEVRALLDDAAQRHHERRRYARRGADAGSAAGAGATRSAGARSARRSPAAS